MKRENQQIAIAEACPSLGWWMDREGHWHFKDGSRMIGGSVLTDLNAMHDAEEHLKDKWLLYSEELFRVCENEIHQRWHATAVQRAEAFLRTIGKWEDE